MKKICAYDECGLEFEPTTHNMKYHSNECCKLATNKRIMQRYYERKAGKISRAGAKRVCKTPGCGSILSRYNESLICGKCESEIEQARKRKLRRMLGEDES